MKKKIYFFMLAIVLAFSVYFFQAHITNLRTAETKPIRGELALSYQDIARKPIALNGEWEFYWKKLIDYGNFSYESPDAYVEVPGYWNSYDIPGKGFNYTGYATYRLHVKLDHIEERLGLKIAPMSSAYRVMINDKVVAENGVVTASEETSKTGYRSLVAIFEAPSSEFDLIIQAANHTFPRGGLWYQIYLGTEEQILEKQLRAAQ